MPCLHCQTPETRQRQRVTQQGVPTFFGCEKGAYYSGSDRVLIPLANSFYTLTLRKGSGKVLLIPVWTYA